MKGIYNHEQVNEEYGLNLTKEEFLEVLVPAWLSTRHDPRYPAMSEDKFVKWYKRSKENHLVAESMARMYFCNRELNHELQDTKTKLSILSIDETLIKQLDETEKFISRAREVLNILKTAKQTESEVSE